MRCGELWQEIRDQERPLSLKRDDLGTLPNPGSIGGITTVVKRSGDRFTQMVKNTYRVLLTRGMKGCYVHFMDKNTENLFRSRLEHTGKVQ